MRSVKTEKNGSLCLIFSAWLVYTTSYLGKVNYSANITQIVDFYSITKAEAGLVPTFFFFAYGIGQVINGILCKRYNIKWMVFISLALSGCINLAIAAATDFSVVKWLWMLNGFLLSILWPTLIRLLSERLPAEHLGQSSVIMGTTVAFGTFIIYALSSLYVSLGNFKLAFYTAAFAAIAVSVIWLVSYNKIAGKLQNQAAEKSADKSKTENASQKHSVIAIICVLCFSAIGVNLIKDGLTTWIPSILKEEGSVPDYLSILLTLSLPVVAVFGNAFALKVHKKISNYVTHCLVVFFAMAVIIAVVIGILPFKLVAVMLIGLAIVNLFASSLNSLITSIFPMFMRNSVNSGKIAGVLNGFCYLGSTVSSYGLGALADNFGWSAVFWCLLGACVLISIVCILHLIFERI